MILPLFITDGDMATLVEQEDAHQIPRAPDQRRHLNLRRNTRLKKSYGPIIKAGVLETNCEVKRECTVKVSSVVG
jgi:hypothetical protein